VKAFKIEIARSSAATPSAAGGLAARDCGIAGDILLIPCNGDADRADCVQENAFCLPECRFA
jgi:hypothetical protein